MSEKIIEIKAPEMLGGESITEASLSEILVNVGDYVSKDQTIFVLETDKTGLDVVSSTSGTIIELLVNHGGTVIPSMLLARLREEEKQTDNNNVQANKGGDVKNAQQVAREAPSVHAAYDGKEMPDVKGTGKNGMILKQDILAHSALSSNPEKLSSSDKNCDSNQKKQPCISDSCKGGDRVTIVKMSKLRKTIATRLKDSQNTAAILTTFNEVDMSEIMRLRSTYKDIFEKKHGIKLGFMSFFVKAVVEALKLYPEINAEIKGDDIIYKNFYDIGVAVGVDKGLVVPVVRNANMLSCGEIEKEIKILADKARNYALKVSDMSDASFTISNGGVYGSLLSTPILNPPQSGILGMHATKERPMVVGGQIVIRPMMYLALSYDHRIVDGSGAVGFLVTVKNFIEEPARMILDV